jgi:hypothetical protein
MPTAKQLNVTSEMINNFNALSELLINTCLSKEETKGGSGTEGEPANDIVREYKKLLIAEYIPQIDIDRFDELADKARSIANERKLKKIDKQENLVNDTLANDEEAL